MKVEIEKFDSPGGIVRVWVDSQAKHGAPYQLALTVKWLSEDTIEFMGLQNPFDGPLGKMLQKEAAHKGVTLDQAAIEFLQSRSPITKEMWKAIQDEAARQGIQRIKAVRMNTGKRREQWIKTKRRRSRDT